MDAAHFVFAPFLGCLWCVARLFVRAASGRKRYNVLGALDAVTHRLIRVTNRLHQRRVGLRAVACGGGGRRGVADHAGAGQRAVPEVRRGAGAGASLGIELLYLPSYSPNLNLIERLWRFVRKQSLNSIYYENFEQFTAAIDECLDELPTVHKGEMATLMTHNSRRLKMCHYWPRRV